VFFVFFFQAEDGIRDFHVTGVQTCALPISCSEYMFLDNTACNLASFNLLKFYDPKTRSLDVEKYEHAIDLWTMVLEISVLMAQRSEERRVGKGCRSRWRECL